MVWQQLFDSLRNFICKNFANQLIISVIFKAKNLLVSASQMWKCSGFFAVFYTKLNMFEFWTISQTKQNIELSHWTLGNYDLHFTVFAKVLYAKQWIILALMLLLWFVCFVVQPFVLFVSYLTLSDVDKTYPVSFFYIFGFQPSL